MPRRVVPRTNTVGALAYLERDIGGHVHRRHRRQRAGLPGRGPLADRLGRRVPVVVGTAAFGALSILNTSAHGPESFIVWRILVGLALGAVLPNIVAIAAEVTPARRRSLVVVVLYSGFAIGSAFAGTVAGRLMPSLGWGSVLWVGGAVQLLLSLAMGRGYPSRRAS